MYKVSWLTQRVLIRNEYPYCLASLSLIWLLSSHGLLFSLSPLSAFSLTTHDSSGMLSVCSPGHETGSWQPVCSSRRGEEGRGWAEKTCLVDHGTEIMESLNACCVIHTFNKEQICYCILLVFYCAELFFILYSILFCSILLYYSIPFYGELNSNLFQFFLVLFYCVLLYFILLFFLWISFCFVLLWCVEVYCIVLSLIISYPILLSFIICACVLSSIVLILLCCFIIFYHFVVQLNSVFCSFFGMLGSTLLFLLYYVILLCDKFYSVVF